MKYLELIQQAETPEDMTELLKECAMKCILCAYFNGCKHNKIENCSLNNYLEEEQA